MKETDACGFSLLVYEEGQCTVLQPMFSTFGRVFDGKSADRAFLDRLGAQEQVDECDRRVKVTMKQINMMESGRANHSIKAAEKGRGL